MTSSQSGAQEQAQYSAVTMLDFDEAGRQTSQQQLVIQPISANVEAANSLVVVVFKDFILGKNLKVSSSTGPVVPRKCEPIESVATVQQVNGNDDTELLNGIPNPPGGDLYEPQKH